MIGSTCTCRDEPALTSTFNFRGQGMLKVNWLPEARCSSLDEVAQRSRCTFRMRRDAASRAASKLEEVMRSCCERCAESASRPDIMSRLVQVEGPMAAVGRALRDELGSRRSVSSAQVSCGGATITVTCPITLQRLRVPCRTAFCCHPSSFDAASFLHCCLSGLTREQWDLFRGLAEGGRPTLPVSQENGPGRLSASTWRCPVCSVAVGPLTAAAAYESSSVIPVQRALVVLDEAIFDVLGDVGDGDRLELRSGDGHWNIVRQRHHPQKRDRVELVLEDV